MFYILILFLNMFANNLMKIGHRGAKGLKPENTIASFKEALKHKVDMLELDVHKTKDNRLVVIHDETVERTTNGRGEVAKMSSADLRKLDAGNGEQIPTLEEVIDAVNFKVPVNIELKGKDTAQLATKIIKKYLNGKAKNSDFIVSSFDHDQLKEFHKILPEIELGKLIINFDDAVLKDIDHIYFMGIDYKNLNNEIADKIKSKNLKLFVYTVNNNKDLDNMKNLGIDGYFTDYPDKL